MMIFKVLITKAFLYWYFGNHFDYTPFSNKKFNNIGGFFKINKSIEKPIFHSNGKIIFHKIFHNSVSLNISKESFFIDYWIDDSLFTFQGALCQNKSFIGQLGIMVTLFAAIYDIVILDTEFKNIH